MHASTCAYRGRTCITLSGRCSVHEQAVIMATLLSAVPAAASPLWTGGVYGCRVSGPERGARGDPGLMRRGRSASVSPSALKICGISPAHPPTS